MSRLAMLAIGLSPLLLSLSAQPADAQAWDAIFVSPGARVSLLIQREMAIDYDPQGRRLTYDAKIDPYHRPRLD